MQWWMSRNEYLNNIQFIYALALLLVAAAGGIDFLTGPDYSVSILYLAPVMLAAWFGGRSTGVVFSMLAALAWLLAELAGKKHLGQPVYLYWNDVMELGFFLIVTIILTALNNALKREKQLSITDHLTGIPNRRYFHGLAAIEMNTSRRYQHPFTVVYIDIDNFKTVNDTLGHSAGDTLLQLVSKTIRDSIRTADVVARIGGDEFALLLTETGSEAAHSAIQNVRKSLEDVIQSIWPVTFSIGMATFIEAPDSVDEMILRVDQLMYSVKYAGKNELRHEVIASGNVVIEDNRS